MSPGVSSELVEALTAVPGLRPWRRAPLAPFTTVGVGGKADLLLTADTQEAVGRAVNILSESEAEWRVLGGGSNIFVADSGYRGVVLKLDDGFHYVEAPRVPSPRSARVVVGAGLPLSRLAVHVADLGLSGLEFACGIPGSVGGGVVMNAGAHGRSLADVVETVHLVTEEGTGWVEGDLLNWGYRTWGLPDTVVVTAAVFRLVTGERQEILQHHRTLLSVRRRTQPRGARTFGSAFKNPEGDHAGRLLESCGLKGVRRGGAQVSPMHANFISNVGDATAADVLGLMTMMRGAVHERLAVLLEPEVHFLGAGFPWERGAGGTSRADTVHRSEEG
ncbi:MAG: UDP-N-acetylmuramate dehydrogenase [Thermoleophilia bacterium]